YFPGAIFARNVFAGGGSSTNWPVDNFFPAGLDAVGFVDRTGGDYRLSATSPYKNAGTHRKDPGADIDALNLATVCVVGGACAPPPDVTPPTVSITAPTAGATVAGNVTVSASASDNVGVAGVQFKLDGANLGAEVSVPPYTVVWPTTLVPNGTHRLAAMAHDAAGNTRTASLTVTVTPTETFTFTDDPLTTQTTLVRAVHILELRAALDSVRVARGLPAFGWTDPTPTPGSTLTKALHLTELRTALNEAYQAAGRVPPTYTDPTVVAGVTVIKTFHLNELRAAVRAL